MEVCPRRFHDPSMFTGCMDGSWKRGGIYEFPKYDIYELGTMLPF